MRNDHNYMGLLPLFNRYSAQLTENDISIRSAQINARAQRAIATSTDNDVETARKYLDDLEAGKLGIMGTSNFLESISVTNISPSSANVIIQLIELQQYLKASWFNELGLNANFNMKREYLSRDERATTTDILLPLVDDMLNCRQEACDFINKVFNTNISVDKSSAWANKNQEVLNSIVQGANDANITPESSIESQVSKNENVQSTKQEKIQSDVQEPKEANPSASTSNSVSDSTSTESEQRADSTIPTTDEQNQCVNELTITINNTVEGESNDTQSKKSNTEQDIS